MDQRLMLVHAHPDDETIGQGATMAGYVARGTQVTLVTCTLGEEGEVIGETWAGLVADRADQLGGYRIHELTVALEALGCRPPRFLGGAGHWRDSGMAGTPAARHPRAFVNADPDEAVGAMVEVIHRVELLRRRIVGRSHAHARLRREGALRVELLGEAKVRHLRAAVRGEEDVRRLDVAMHDAALMRDLQRIADLRDPFQRCLRGARTGLDRL